MKKLNELKIERSEMNDKINVLLAAEELTKEQRSEITELETSVDGLKDNIEMLERQEKRNAEFAAPVIIKDINDDEGSNLTRSLTELFTKGHVTEDFRGTEGLLLPESMFRADPILTSTDTGIINKVVTPEINIKKSYGESFLRDLGVRFYEGTNGNLVLSSMPETTATQTAESGNATSAGQTPTSITLSAKRLDAVQGYNREFLAQTSTYGGLLQDLVDSIGVKMVYQFFDNMEVDAVDASVQGTSSGITYGDILGLEANLADVMGSAKFVTTPSAKQFLKNLNSSSAGISFAWDNQNSMIGLPALAGNGINANQIWLGDWSKAAVATFGSGGIEVVVDPYSAKEAGKIEVYAVRLVDSGTPNYRNFSWIGDASISI